MQITVKSMLRKILEEVYIVKKILGQDVFLPPMHDSYNLPVTDTQPREAEEQSAVSAESWCPNQTVAET